MKRLCVLLATLLCFSVLTACGTKPTGNSTDSIEPGSIDRAKVGDTVFFGAYEQDNDETDGKEPIEWIVLAKENGRILVVSKYLLECDQYHVVSDPANIQPVSWEECRLRAWLNDDFYSDAFSEAEQKQIPEVTVPAQDNLEYDSDAGNDTTDRVFLLSVQEAEHYFNSDAERICEVTPYAERNRANTLPDTKKCTWWLRSPGRTEREAVFVTWKGEIYSYGVKVTSRFEGIRPAMWIDATP